LKRVDGEMVSNI